MSFDSVLEETKKYLGNSELFNPINHFYVPAFHAHKVALDVHTLNITYARKILLFFVYSFGGGYTAYVLSGDKLPILDNLIVLYSLIFLVSGFICDMAKNQKREFTIYRYLLALGDEWVKCRSIQNLHIKFGKSPNNHAIRNILLASLGGYGGGLWDYVFNISKQHKHSILDVSPVDFMWTSVVPNIWSSVVVSIFLHSKKNLLIATGVKIAIFLSILIRNIQDAEKPSSMEEKTSIFD